MIKLKKNEVILFKGNGIFLEKEVNIILTNQRLVLLKNRLFFKRTFIKLDSIKKVNGRYKFQISNNRLIIETNKDICSIIINDKKKLKELYNQLYYALYGEHPTDKIIEGAKKIALFAMPFIQRKSSKLLKNVFKLK